MFSEVGLQSQQKLKNASVLLVSASCLGTPLALYLVAYGMYFRYVKGLRVNNVVLRYMNRDECPAFILDDVHDASSYHIDAQKGEDAPQFILNNVSKISIHEVNDVDDVKVEKAKMKEL